MTESTMPISDAKLSAINAIMQAVDYAPHDRSLAEQIALNIDAVIKAARAYWGIDARQRATARTIGRSAWAENILDSIMPIILANAPQGIGDRDYETMVKSIMARLPDEQKPTPITLTAAEAAARAATEQTGLTSYDRALHVYDATIRRRLHVEYDHDRDEIISHIQTEIDHAVAVATKALEKPRPMATDNPEDTPRPEAIGLARQIMALFFPYTRFYAQENSLNMATELHDTERTIAANISVLMSESSAAAWDMAMESKPGQASRFNPDDSPMERAWAVIRMFPERVRAAFVQGDNYKIANLICVALASAYAEGQERGAAEALAKPAPGKLSIHVTVDDLMPAIKTQIGRIVAAKIPENAAEAMYLAADWIAFILAHPHRYLDPDTILNGRNILEFLHEAHNEGA